MCHSCVFVYIARLVEATAGSLLCLSYLQLTQGSLMCVVQVISSCKEAMTMNYFPLVLSSLFCSLSVTLYNRFCFSLLLLLLYSPAVILPFTSSGTSTLKRWEAAGAWLPATPLQLLGDQPCSQASPEGLQPQLAAAGAVGRSTWLRES